MNKFRLLSLILVLCFVSALALTACDDTTVQMNQSNAGTDDPNASADTSTDVSYGEFQDSTGKYVGSTSGTSYSGKTITFLTCSVNSTYESEILYNPYADESKKTYVDGTTVTMPEVLNDSLKRRAELVEEKLGITIEELKVLDGPRPGGGMSKAIKEGNLSFTDEYQIVVPCLYDGAALSVNNMFYNLYDITSLQMDAPWWNQAFNESMTYAGQLYFTIGDLGIGNKSSTAALYVNIDLWTKNGLTEKFGANPYDLVRQGKWTVDTVFEAASLISRDVDGSGVIDYKDEFGWGGQLDDMWSIFYGSGERIAKADANGYPALSMYSERSAKLMETLQEFVQSDTYYISANDYFGVVQWPSVLVQEAFTSGRALFYNGNVGTVIELGVMEQHFGMMPIPKADEIQEEYYSLVNPWSSTCFAIPVCVPESQLQMVSDVLNVMGAESMNVVSPNYKEILEYMKIRDDDSVDMLNNYILPNRGCDIGMAFKWGGLDTLLHDMASATVGTFASAYQNKETIAQNQLNATLEFFKDNEK
ncbi:MAG: hypothetical protein IKY21_06270 [Clostridia bacterium]|nr:hypothetical protein [Clostridia bacterium]